MKVVVVAGVAAVAVAFGVACEAALGAAWASTVAAGLLAAVVLLEAGEIAGLGEGKEEEEVVVVVVDGMGTIAAVGDVAAGEVEVEVDVDVDVAAAAVVAVAPLVETVVALLDSHSCAAAPVACSFSTAPAAPCKHPSCCPWACDAAAHAPSQWTTASSAFAPPSASQLHPRFSWALVQSMPSHLPSHTSCPVSSCPPDTPCHSCTPCSDDVLHCGVYRSCTSLTSSYVHDTTDDSR